MKAGQSTILRHQKWGETETEAGKRMKSHHSAIKQRRRNKNKHVFVCLFVFYCQLKLYGVFVYTMFSFAQPFVLS